MKKIYLSIISIFFSLFLFSTPASAKVVLQEKGTVTVDKSEIIDDDLFVGAESVIIDGTVKGSVFVGAGNITIAGNIAGDVIAGTGNLTLNGAVVGGNLIAGAGQINIDDKSKIGGSLIAGTGNLHNSAPVGRSVMVGAGTAYLNNTIGKELRFGGSSLELGSKAKVMGDLTFALGEDKGNFIQAPESSISGSVTRYTPPPQMRKDAEKAREDFRLAGKVAGRGFMFISFLGSIVIGFLLLKLFPKTLHSLSAQITDKTMGSMGVGFLIAIVSIPALLIIALTVIGLPLAGMLLLVLMLSMHLAKLFASFALGQFIAKQFSWNKMGNYAIFFVGLVVFYILKMIPGIGWLSSMLFTWTGLGALWIYLSANLKKL